MEHNHNVYDTDTHFKIDPITRIIKNESSRKTTLVQHDHNSERFTFELPRYIEGHDMSECNKVEVHFLNIDATTRKQNSGVYVSDDLQINTEDSEKVICSWLISNNATQLVGTLSFIVRFCCVEDSTVTYVWNTAIASINVSTGINAGESVVTEYADILEKWKADLFAAGYINAETMAAELEGLKSRIRVENDAAAEKGVFEGLNFAGQGADSGIYAFILHNYTDGGILRLDNVGNGSIIQAVNAHNSTHRSDKDSDYHGNGNVLEYLVQADPEGDNSYGQYVLMRIDKDGMPWWSGWDNANAGNDEKNKTVKLQTGKLDGGTWAFNLDATNLNKYVLLLSTAGLQVLQVKTSESGACVLQSPNGMQIVGGNHLNLVSNGNIVLQTANDDPLNAIRFRMNGVYYYPQFTNKTCTSTERPTTASVGEIYLESDTNRTIRRNAANNGWVDMNGNAV